jgi:hypothetical protein
VVRVYPVFENGGRRRSQSTRNAQLRANSIIYHCCMPMLAYVHVYRPMRHPRGRTPIPTLARTHAPRERESAARGSLSRSKATSSTRSTDSSWQPVRAASRATGLDHAVPRERSGRPPGRAHLPEPGGARDPSSQQRADRNRNGKATESYAEARGDRRGARLPCSERQEVVASPQPFSRKVAPKFSLTSRLRSAHDAQGSKRRPRRGRPRRPPRRPLPTPAGIPARHAPGLRRCTNRRPHRPPRPNRAHLNYSLDPRRHSASTREYLRSADRKRDGLARES